MDEEGINSITLIFLAFSKEYLFSCNKNGSSVMARPTTRILLYLLVFIMPLWIWGTSVLIGNYWADMVYPIVGKNMFTEYDKLHKPPFNPNYELVYTIIYPPIMILLGFSNYIVLFVLDAFPELVALQSFGISYFFHFFFMFLLYPLFWGLGTLGGVVTVYSVGLILILFLAIAAFTISKVITIILILEFLLILMESLFIIELSSLNDSIWK